MRRLPPGCHQFHNLAVCNRCGHKQPRDDEGTALMWSHLAECHYAEQLRIQERAIEQKMARCYALLGDLEISLQNCREARQAAEERARAPESPDIPAEVPESDREPGDPPFSLGSVTCGELDRPTGG